MNNILIHAIRAAGGPNKVGAACGVTGNAVRKWMAAGKLPRTEYTGETEYWKTITGLTLGKYTRADLLTRDVA